MIILIFYTWIILADRNTLLSMFGEYEFVPIIWRPGRRKGMPELRRSALRPPPLWHPCFRKAVVVFATLWRRARSERSRDGFHARQSDYILFSNKLFASIATRRQALKRPRFSLSYRDPRFHIVTSISRLGTDFLDSTGLATFFMAFFEFEIRD
jgi:hypothetical protein